MRADVTERDLADYLVALTFGPAIWAVESYGVASALVVDPAWTAIGAGVGVVAVLLPLYSVPVRRFQDRLRDSIGTFLAVMVVGVALGYVLVTTVDVAIRPAHYSAFLGFAPSQLLGIGLYRWG